jgi:ABC-2 type transport system permease protein
VVDAAHFGAEQSRASLGVALREADRLAARQREIQVAASFPSGTTARGQYDYGLVGTLVLFMFITAISGGALLVDARRRGVVARLLATELRSRSLLVAEVLSRYVTVLVQAGIVLIFGTVLFGIHWGPPLPVALVVGMYGLVGAAAGIAVGVIARTFEQAIIFGTVSAIGLGMLGGCLWPLRVAPPALRSLARFTPQHWAIDGLLRLVDRSSGLPGIGTSLLVLAGFAVAIMALSARRLRHVATL